MMRVIVIAIVMCVLHSNRLSTLAQSQIPLQVCVEGDGGSSCANSGSSSEDGSNGLGNEDVDKQQWKDVLLFPDGGIYSGGVANGVQEGEGREESAEGDRYDGEWEGGVKSGAGKYIWKDGSSYKGNSSYIYCSYVIDTMGRPAVYLNLFFTNACFCAYLVLNDR